VISQGASSTPAAANAGSDMQGRFAATPQLVSAVSFSSWNSLSKAGYGPSEGNTAVPISPTASTAHVSSTCSVNFAAVASAPMSAAVTCETAEIAQANLDTHAEGPPPRCTDALGPSDQAAAAPDVKVPEKQMDRAADVSQNKSEEQNYQVFTVRLVTSYRYFDPHPASKSLVDKEKIPAIFVSEKPSKGGDVPDLRLPKGTFKVPEVPVVVPKIAPAC